MDRIQFTNRTENKMTRQKRTVLYPHYVRLPAGSRSPTDSIYKQYDIARQSSVLCHFDGAPGVVRSGKSFVLRVKLPSGKIKFIESKEY